METFKPKSKQENMNEENILHEVALSTIGRMGENLKK